MARGYTVQVVDMSKFGEPDGEQLVQGFTSAEHAEEYAVRRVRASLEELRAANQDPDELRRLWFLFGQDALVVETEFSGSMAMDRYLLEPASPEECDWTSVAPRGR